MKERIRIEGAMVEKALTRLARHGVSVYSVEKISTTKTLLSVRLADLPLLNTLLPEGGAYKVVRLGAVGAFAPIARLCKRTGIVLGALCFLLLTLLSNSFIFQIEISSELPLHQEVLAVLKTQGIAPFRVYSEQAVKASYPSILALRGVSFCSLKKKGSVLYVELRGNSFLQEEKRASTLVSDRAGTLLALQVLRGEAVATVGEEIAPLQVLAEASGENDFVVAYARLACFVEVTVEEGEEEEEVARALLSVYSEGVQVQKITKNQTGNGVVVRIDYEYRFSVNDT